MIDNIELNNELERFYGEKKMNEDILLSEREKFIKALKNGIGEELKEYLENPPKAIYQKSFKMKLKQYYNNLIKFFKIKKNNI